MGDEGGGKGDEGCGLRDERCEMWGDEGVEGGDGCGGVVYRWVGVVGGGWLG